LREPHLARGPPRSPGPSEHPDFIRPAGLNGEHLVISGLGLAGREPEDLAGRSPDLQLLMVLVPKCQQRSLHCDSFPGEWTLLTAAQLQVYAATPEKQRCRPHALRVWFRGSRLNSDRLMTNWKSGRRGEFNRDTSPGREGGHIRTILRSGPYHLQPPIGDAGSEAAQSFGRLGLEGKNCGRCNGSSIRGR